MLLQTTGAGLQWVATSSLGISGGGSSQWTTTGSDVYFTGGKVGIGSSGSPSKTLSVTGQTSISQSLAIGPAASITDTDNVFSSIASGDSQGGGSVNAKHASIAFGHSVGNSISATGYGSFAGGYSDAGTINANGNGSFAFGNNLTANGQTSIAFGSGFTNGISNSFMVGFTATPAFTVNNTSVGIGTTTPSAQFTTTGAVRFGALTGAGSNLIVDSLGNVTVSSDERLKNIDGQFTRGLADLQKINPITFHWKASTGYDTENAYTGFSAQNVQLAIPEAVAMSSNGYLSIADRPILATLVNAVKELSVKLDGVLAWFAGGKFHVNDDVCVDDVCVTKEQFKAILLKNGAVTQTNSPVTQSSSSAGTNVDSSSSSSESSSSTSSFAESQSSSSSDSSADKNSSQDADTSANPPVNTSSDSTSTSNTQKTSSDSTSASTADSSSASILPQSPAIVPATTPAPETPASPEVPAPSSSN